MKPFTLLTWLRSDISALCLQGGEWSHAAGTPCGDASESASPVHRVSFAISMDISALSGTSSNVEIVPVTETLQPAHAQLRRSSSSIPRPEAASRQEERPGAPSAAAGVAWALWSRTGRGEEAIAGASGTTAAENDITRETGQAVEEAALDDADEGETPQKRHQVMKADDGPDIQDWIEVKRGELRDEQLTPGIPESESDGSHVLFEGMWTDPSPGSTINQQFYVSAFRNYNPARERVYLTERHLTSFRTLQELTGWPKRHTRDWTMRSTPCLSLH